MKNPDFLLNGIDSRTGNYLPKPGSPPEPPSETDTEHLDPDTWRWRRWWTENYGIDDPDLQPAQGVDPCKVSTAGWGVLFAPDVPQKHREALQPLLDHRMKQAGKFYRSYEHGGPEQSAEAFLTAQGAPSGPANPEKVPYYLLLVGDPETMPFRFQYELDVQYAVGRLSFDSADEYRNYAESVIKAERKKTTGQSKPTDENRLTFFSVRKPEDLASERTTERLVVPLTQSVVGERNGWKQSVCTGLDADRDRLLSILGGEETPNLAFIACHGVRFDGSPEEQREMQGSLVCAEWPGPGKPPEDQHILTGADLKNQSNLLGLVVMTFACYSGGTPEHDGFDFEALGRARRIAPKPFVSRLGQRLLGHRNGGALALIAHVDRAWTASFHHAVTDTASPEVFKSTLQRLLDGHPVGSATEYVNQRYAELSVRLSSLWDHELSRLESADPDHLLRTRLANNDARSYVVFGDPAVKVMGAPSPCMNVGAPSL